MLAAWCVLCTQHRKLASAFLMLMQAAHAYSHPVPTRQVPGFTFYLGKDVPLFDLRRVSSAIDGNPKNVLALYNACNEQPGVCVLCVWVGWVPQGSHRECPACGCGCCHRALCLALLAHDYIYCLQLLFDSQMISSRKIRKLIQSHTPPLGHLCT